MAPDSTDEQNLAASITDVSERVSLLVREEIELARAEITTKLTKLARGAAVGTVAGVFVILAFMMALSGLAWLLYYELPIGNDFTYFWGFFALAVILLVLGVVAGFVAWRFFRAGAPPKPDMAIDEARKIRETVGASTDGSS